jgi:hypothetical protein
MAAQLTIDGFEKSVETDPVPPPGLGAALRALWLDARGDWAAAHAAVQSEGGRDAAWVHAYLHRKEGDEANAGYWYARAGRGAAAGALDRERREIARQLLAAAE